MSLMNLGWWSWVLACSAPSDSTVEDESDEYADGGWLEWRQEARMNYANCSGRGDGSSVAYDAAGWATHGSNDGAAWSWRYTVVDSIVTAGSLTDANGVVRFTFDEAGNRVSEDGVPYGLEYDDEGLLVRTTGDGWMMEYDQCGNWTFFHYAVDGFESYSEAYYTYEERCILAEAEVYWDGEFGETYTYEDGREADGWEWTCD